MKLLTHNGLLVLLVVAGLAACNVKTTEKIWPENETMMQDTSKEALIKRGLYLTTIGACNDCHSPKIMTEHGPEPDPTRLLSGHPRNKKVEPIATNSQWILFSDDLTAFVGPWGMSYAANLTPDDTGIGAWSFDQFKTAIRKGKYKGLEGSRDLLPPMPWQMYRNFTDDDLMAVFTYLKSLPKIDNLVPAPVPPQDLLTLK